MRRDVPWCPGTGDPPAKVYRQKSWSARARGECPSCHRNVSFGTNGMHPHSHLTRTPIDPGGKRQWPR